MKVELEVLGIDKEGVNYSAIYNWSDNDSDEIIELNLQKFTDGYNVFLINHGVNALLKLVNSFVTTNTVLVPLYTEA